MGKISTGIKNVFQRNVIKKSEEQFKEDILREHKDVLEDISQRRGLNICSGLSIAERDYILSDSMIASAIQLYVADILAICKRQSCMIKSDINSADEFGEIAEKEEIVNYVFNQIFSDTLVETIGLNLLTNGEIFLNTLYNRGLNTYSVTETSYTRCTQLCFSDGSTAKYICSDVTYSNSDEVLSYSYNLNNSTDEQVYIEPEKMVRIFNPTLINSKVKINLGEDDKDITASIGNDLYYSNSQSLLKQIYPDWLNGKLLELAVYRDRIAKSRFIQLIAIELGRTSRVTSDQIYDNVKDYFDKRSVIDLEKQTFKSVVGDEPFTDYKVYTTRNGNGQLTFDNSLNGSNPDVSSLADLDYNLTKLFAGIGIPKQFLGADDNGSALSNGGSLFFMSESYQKRIIAYVKRIANGIKECIKNLVIQQRGKEFFYNWDFTVEFEIPESNEDVYRVKNARLDYVNSVIDLIDKIEIARSEGKEYSMDAISDSLQEDIKKFVITPDNESNIEGE